MVASSSLLPSSNPKTGRAKRLCLGVTPRDFYGVTNRGECTPWHTSRGSGMRCVPNPTPNTLPARRMPGLPSRFRQGRMEMGCQGIPCPCTQG